MTTQPSWIVRLAAAVRALGPYAAVELLLPGGSVIALSLWVFRHRARLATHMRRALAQLAALCATLILRTEASFSAPSK